MLIYNGLKSDFMSDTENDVLEKKLYDAIKNKMNRSTGLSELNSWRNSLKEMYITLNDSNIPSDVGVAIEYNIPQTSKRVDFLISGYGKDNKGNVIIVELKQWEKLQAIEGQEAIVETFTGGANRRVVHPSYQAWSYAALIKDYNEYNNIIKNLEKEKRALALENQNLKNEVRNLKSSIEAARIGEKEITNVDLLRRISQLEKIILGKSEQ